ncbi:response regulator [Bacillus solimangrovi]|uniref:DNA-binding response regulator n=1 Tax=Bacillus solimangrovi TaxID=1305675 RepID=A0A1E5LFW0_9BACI|nr:response regulator transcription factor [Bacillus solimangrovi]OEH92961.1 DNA-binding response regulator [Bacillus solimangrovi]
MSIRVLIADDHPMVRQGLVYFLKTQKDIEVIGEASNGQEAVELANSLCPHIVLLDLQMPVLDGVEATKQIKKQVPETEVIILTSFSEQDDVIPAIEAGASGYQLKEIEPDELVQIIHAVHKGERRLHPSATSHLMSHLSNGGKEKNLLDDLTPREKEVLREIAHGKSNKEIASSLVITEKTVKTHVTNIFGKLQVSDRTQAALYAVKHGI